MRSIWSFDANNLAEERSGRHQHAGMQYMISNLIMMPINEVKLSGFPAR